jgi:hypothetical protein
MPEYEAGPERRWEGGPTDHRHHNDRGNAPVETHHRPGLNPPRPQVHQHMPDQGQPSHRGYYGRPRWHPFALRLMRIETQQLKTTTVRAISMPIMLPTFAMPQVDNSITEIYIEDLLPLKKFLRCARVDLRGYRVSHLTKIVRTFCNMTIQVGTDTF